MKSRTSFFNFTVLRKDIFRYAPVWGLYAIGLLLFLLVPNLDWDSMDAADVMASCISSMAYVNLILGGVSALLVFGDLFKARLCYATHALPLRREGWFFTHFTAGILFSFVPNLLLTLCFLPLLQGYWYMAFLWLAGMTLQYLFFFGAAVFCAVCAGNRLGAAAAYVILNFGILLVNWYMDSFYAPLLYGIEYRGSFIELLMPVGRLIDLDFVDYTRRPFTFHGIIPGAWQYLGITAAVGIALAVAALLIYRKRDLEAAGDFLSLPAAKPAFLIIYTLSVGYLFSQLIWLEYLGMFVGLLVGFFTGKMLLERTVKVFRGWNFLQFGILITVLAVSIGLTALDPMGLTRYVPDTDEVDSMQFFDSSDSHLYWNDPSVCQNITDPAEIEQFLQFHEELTDRRYQGASENTVPVYLCYQLKNGRTVYRRYTVPVASDHGQFAKEQLSSWQSVFYTDDWERFVSRIEQLDLEINSGIEIGHFTLKDPQQVKGLLEAVKADCDAGNMAQNWSFHGDEDTVAWLYIYDAEYYSKETTVIASNEQVYGNVYSFSLNIFECCTNTRAYIDSLNLEIEPYEK